MSSFNPTQVTLDPPDRPDHLAGAVLLSLARPIGKRPPSGPIKAFFLAAISFGLLPILIWPRRFKDRLAAEQQQIWHFMEWITLRTHDADAVSLRDACQKSAPKLFPSSLVLILSLTIGYLIAHVRGFEDFLYSGRFTFNRYPLIGLSWRRANWKSISTVWAMALIFALAWHFLMVLGANARMKWLVQQINPIFRRQGISEIQRRALGFPGIGWILAAVVGVYFGAIWATAAALAGWAQRAYALNVSWNVRQDLSQRVQTILIRQRPAVKVPTPNSLRPVCSNALCGKPAVSGAAFCTRCGTRISDVRFQAVA